MADGKKLRKWLDSIEKIEEDTGNVKHHQFQKSFSHAKKHAVTHKDLDVDSDVDALDKTTPDEIIGTEKGITKKMMNKYSKEKQHTRKGVAFEGTELKSFTSFSECISEDVKAGLMQKADKSGISYGILKKVFDRGMAAYKSGHRPGTTAQQWAYARVNSFINGGKTRTTADADLWKQAKG
jgi:hypothetical protein